MKNYVKEIVSPDCPKGIHRGVLILLKETELLSVPVTAASNNGHDCDFATHID